MGGRFSKGGVVRAENGSKGVERGREGGVRAWEATFGGGVLGGGTR